MARSIAHIGSQLALFTQGPAGVRLASVTPLPEVEPTDPALEEAPGQPTLVSNTALALDSASAPAMAAAPALQNAVRRFGDPIDGKRLRHLMGRHKHPALDLVSQRLKALPTLAYEPSAHEGELLKGFLEDQEDMEIEHLKRADRKLLGITRALAVSQAVDDLTESRRTLSPSESRWAPLSLPEPPLRPIDREFLANGLALFYRREGRAVDLRSDDIQLEAWFDSEHGAEILTRFFLELAIRGEDVSQPLRPIEAHAAAIATKRRWVDYLAGRGVTAEDLEAELTRLTSDTRHAALLNSVTRHMGDRLTEAPYAGNALAGDILKLHADDHVLGGETFLAVLPQYVAPLTLESATALLHRYDREKTDFPSVARAGAVLLWHAGGSSLLAERIKELLARNRSLRTLKAFCAQRLAVTPEEFEAQIVALERDDSEAVRKTAEGIRDLIDKSNFSADEDEPTAPPDPQLRLTF